jgi:type VI secretion system protein ImpH
MSSRDAQILRHREQDEEYLRRVNDEARLDRALRADDLESRLERLPHRFDFFQAVRRLEARAGAQFARVGYAVHRKEEPLHFGQEPFLGFAPRAIQRWSRQPVDTCRFPRCPVLLVYLFGLLGPNAPLPRHLTEFAAHRQRRQDFAFTNFLNLLQHRFLSYFYRAWAVLHPVTDLDRPGPQPFARVLGSLVGIGDRFAESPLGSPSDEFSDRRSDSNAARLERETGGERTVWQHEGMSEWPRLFFSGRLAGEARPAEGLEGILRAYFGADAQVQTFVGRWLPLEAADLTRLGRGTAELGRSTLLGGRVWDCQTAFRVRLGPTLGPETLAPEHVVDFRGLARRLRSPDHPVVRYLAARLAPKAAASLSAWSGEGEVPESLGRTLLDSLNAVIRGHLIWEENRFKGVSLRSEVRALLDAHPPEGDASRLNRLLLEDALPQVLSREAGLDRFRRYLPGGPAARRLRDWVLDYVGWEFHWDLELVLRCEDVPDLVLGGSTQLGRTTFLKTRPPPRDVDGIVFSMSEPATRHG